MARQRQKAPPPGRFSRGSGITLFSYLCALVFAAALIRAAVPEGFGQGGGLEKKYLPYLVLELPVDSGRVTQGPLADPLSGEDPGEPHSSLRRGRGDTPEEYLRWLREWPWEGEHLTRRVRGTEYEIYWVPAAGGTTQVPIPVGYGYNLSGDGESGFVVTAWKQKEARLPF